MEIPSEIITQLQSVPKPCLIGVSGFGGSGKSTFARELGILLTAPVISVDSFMKNRTSSKYALWEIMDFSRLTSEVLQPFLDGKNPISYGHFDWSANAIHHTETVSHQGMLIIEGVGLFRPELHTFFDFKIWIDCPLDEAIRRGKKRDREENHNQQDENWDGIWKKNDQEYFSALKPKENADLVINNN